MSSSRLRLLAAALGVVALLALLLAGYLAWLQVRAGGFALPTLPAPAREPEITLTPEEAADAEAQLRGVVFELLKGGVQVEKITKVGQDYVFRSRSKDAVVEFRVRRATDQDQAGKTPDQTPGQIPGRTPEKTP